MKVIYKRRSDNNGYMTDQTIILSYDEFIAYNQMLEEKRNDLLIKQSKNGSITGDDMFNYVNGKPIKDIRDRLTLTQLNRLREFFNFDKKIKYRQTMISIDF